MAKHPGGRPTIMNDKAVAKLEHAFMMDCNVTQACLYANISRNTYYDYIEKHPSFKTRVEDLKQNMLLRSKMVVARDILQHQKVDTAKWFLERKDDSFSNKNETKVTGDLKVSNPYAGLTEEELRKLAREGDG